MMLFKERLQLRDKFYEWADKERFGERTPELFLVFMLVNGLIDEEKTKKFIGNKPKGAAGNDQPTT